MVAIDWNEMQKAAGDMIRDWGAPAKLLRGASTRECFGAVLDYTPRTQGLALEGSQRMLMVAPLAIPPDHEHDKLIWKGGLYQLPSPVKGPRPGGPTVFYDFEVLFERAYP